MSSNVANTSNGPMNRRDVERDKKDEDHLLLPIIHPNGKVITAIAQTQGRNPDKEYTVRFHIDTQSIVEPRREIISQPSSSYHLSLFILSGKFKGCPHQSVAQGK
jgi:hypothetical protein